MNSKTMAIAAAFVMLAAALSVTMFLPSADADDVTSFELGEKEVTLTPDGKGSLLFNVSEAEYINLGYTINWYIAQDDGSGSDHSATFGDSSILGSRTVNAGTSVDNVTGFSPDFDGVKLGGYVFKIQAMDDLGTYLLTIDANNSTDKCKGIVKCEVIVNISEDETITIPNNYGLVTVNNNASSPVSLNTMTFTVGEADAFTVSGSSVTVGGNSWYAIGLPKGLSMSPNGVVSGMPTGIDASGSEISDYITPISVDVYSTTNEGKISTYTLSVKINEASSAKMTLSLSSASTTLVESGTTYTAIQGTNDIKLTITPVASTLEWASVTVIDTDGQVQVDYDLVDGAEIPSDGIGSYKIVVNAIIDSKHVTGSVTLNVISPMDSIEAGIIVSGA